MSKNLKALTKISKSLLKDFNHYLYILLHSTRNCLKKQSSFFLKKLSLILAIRNIENHRMSYFVSLISTLFQQILIIYLFFIISLFQSNFYDVYNPYKSYIFFKRYIFRNWKFFLKNQVFYLTLMFFILFFSIYFNLISFLNL